MSFLNSIKQNKNLVISILAFSFVFIIAQWLQDDVVFDRNAIQQGQWWKLLTGNFTHSNIPHLLLNLSGVLLLGLLFIDNLSSRTFIFSSVFLALIVGLGLYFFTPELNRYYGFSGVLYGLYFVAAIGAILDNDLFTGISVALLISVKIVWDFFSGGNQSSAELIGIPVANDAHLYGFIGSVLIAGFLLFKWVLKSKKGHPPTF